MMTGYPGSAPPAPRAGRTHATASIARFIGYALCLFAGILMHTLGPPFTQGYTLLGDFMAVGGALCVISPPTGRWVWELMGLPLIGSAMVSFGVLTYADAYPQAGWVAIPSVVILVGFGLLALARWIDLFALARSAVRMKKRGR